MEDHTHEKAAATAAKNFGDSLDSVFGIEKPLAELSQKVEEKKREVDTRNEELEAIERRLRETEERLARATGSQSSSPVKRSPINASPQRAAAQGEDYRPVPPSKNGYSHGEEQQIVSGMARHPERGSVKPLNPRQDSLGMPPMPGAMPASIPGTPSGLDQHGQGYINPGTAR